MDENNNKEDTEGSQLIPTHPGGIICTGCTDIDTEDEDDGEDQEKSYQTLSSVKYGEAPPHVIEAVKGLTASSAEQNQFCPAEMFEDKTGETELTPIAFPSATDASSTVSSQSTSADPINCSFAYLNRSTSDCNTNNATISSRNNSSVASGDSDQRQHTNSRKRPLCDDQQHSHDDGPHQRKQARSGGNFTQLSQSASPATRTAFNVIQTSRSFKPRPNCWQSSHNTDALGVLPARSHWAVLRGCDHDNSDQSATSCNLTQTLLVPDLSRPASFASSGPARPQNQWPNFRPLAPWADEGDGNQCASSDHSGSSSTPSTCDQEIRNETFPMTRRYIIRNMVSSGSPTNVFAPRSFMSGHRGTGDGVNDPPYPPVVQRPYAYPSVIPKSMQMLSRNVHFVNNYAAKGSTIPSSFKNKVTITELPQGCEIITKGLPSHISTKDVFCLVPGRLGMPNQSKRHEVLVGEILRRVLTPESLNISLLGPILRKAKSKNGTQYLREKLQQIGVELPPGRRKTAKCTLFTSLTESEAGQLSEDFSKLCQYEFPAKALAKKALQRQCADETPFITSESIAISLKLLDCFTEILGIKTHDPFHESNMSFSNGRSSHAASQLYNFETLTHGFGVKALVSSLRTFRAFLLYLDE